MDMFYVYCLFNTNRKPIAAGYIDSAGEKFLFNINGKGCNTTLFESRENQETFTLALAQALADNEEVHTTGFKQIVNAFCVPLVPGADYNVYDHGWESMVDEENGKTAMAFVSKMLDRLLRMKPQAWKKIFANAAVMYQALENRGVHQGLKHVYPTWWQTTYSGRSKNTGCNIQGSDGNDLLRLPDSMDDDYFVYFDWVAADMRVAAELSGDEGFLETFRLSDPYTEVARELVDIPRDECKRLLLQAINSFSYDDPLLSMRFPRLGDWLRECHERLNTEKALESILGRRFTVDRAKDNNPRAVMNGVLQGSVAHGMQLTGKRIWDVFPDRLLVEIHDSVAMMVNDDTASGVIKAVAKIMTRPFAGYLESNPFFPVKVSIGTKFRQWKTLMVYREDGIDYVGAKKQKGEGEEEGAAAESDGRDQADATEAG